MEFTDVTRRVRMYNVPVNNRNGHIFVPDPPKSARIWYYKSPEAGGEKVVDFNSISKMYNNDDEKFAKAVSTLRRGYNKVNKIRGEKSIKLVEYIKPATPRQKTKASNASQATRCAATTMKGKPCPFRATCGKFCKKHKL